MSNLWQVDLKRSKEDGEKCYDQLSNEEREKFDEETLVNLNNKDKRSTRSQSFDGFSNEYTMVCSDYFKGLVKCASFYWNPMPNGYLMHLKKCFPLQFCQVNSQLTNFATPPPQNSSYI